MNILTVIARHTVIEQYAGCNGSLIQLSGD